MAPQSPTTSAMSSPHHGCHSPKSSPMTPKSSGKPSPNFAIPTIARSLSPPVAPAPLHEMSPPKPPPPPAKKSSLASVNSCAKSHLKKSPPQSSAGKPPVFAATHSSLTSPDNLEQYVNACRPSCPLFHGASNSSADQPSKRTPTSARPTTQPQNHNSPDQPPIRTTTHLRGRESAGRSSRHLRINSTFRL